MGIWDRLFGDREPSVEREQVAAEAAVMQREQEAPAPESEVKRVKKFAAVLRSPEREGDPPDLDRDWEIVKINDQTGEVTVRKEGVGKKYLSHEKFWNLNFPRSDEMLDTLAGEQKKVSDKAYHGIKGEKRVRARELAHFDQIVEAFKSGELNPMREHFAESLARFQREARGVEEQRVADQKRLIGEIEAQDEYLLNMGRQLAVAEGEKRKRLLKDEIGRAEDWKKSLSLQLGRLNDPLPTNPELERLKGFVQVLDREIDARERRARAA